MSDFLKKYYPGIQKDLHKKRIQNLIELLDTEKEVYEKTYKERADEIQKDT